MYVCLQPVRHRIVDRLVACIRGLATPTTSEEEAVEVQTRVARTVVARRRDVRAPVPSVADLGHRLGAAHFERLDEPRFDRAAVAREALLAHTEGREDRANYLKTTSLKNGRYSSKYPACSRFGARTRPRSCKACCAVTASSRSSARVNAARRRLRSSSSPVRDPRRTISTSRIRRTSPGCPTRCWPSRVCEAWSSSTRSSARHGCTKLADRPKAAKYLILGSAAPELVKDISETLAGRVVYHELGGLSSQEVGIRVLERLWERGGFPRSFLARSHAQSVEWRDGFIRSFLERDVPALGLGGLSRKRRPLARQVAV